jgi:hypothetical protein
MSWEPPPPRPVLYVNASAEAAQGAHPARGLQHRLRDLGPLTDSPSCCTGTGGVADFLAMAGRVVHWPAAPR